MEWLEWSRLIAPLLYVSELSAMSKLLSARSKPPSTPSGHSFNPLENRFTQNPKKSLFVHTSHSVLLLTQEIIVEILRGNKTWSSFCGDRPQFPH
jgi:hypothetical protein